jgi:hypothetical protein
VKNRTGEGCYARTPIFFQKSPPQHAYAPRFFFANVSLRHLHVSRVYARVTWARRMGMPVFSTLRGNNTELTEYLNDEYEKRINQDSVLSVSPRMSITWTNSVVWVRCSRSDPKTEMIYIIIQYSSHSDRWGRLEKPENFAPGRGAARAVGGREGG